MADDNAQNIELKEAIQIHSEQITSSNSTQKTITEINLFNCRSTLGYASRIFIISKSSKYD